MFDKTWTITRRTALSILAICFVSTIVAGSILSNYLLPSTVRITSQPGISVFLGDASTNTCSTTPVTSYDWGDVQLSQSKSALVVCIKNSGGTATAYLIDGFTTSGAAISSLTTQPNPIANGVSLSWNFASVESANPGCAGSTINGHCAGIAPGSQSPPLTLTLSASTSASPASLSFTIEFDAFTTVNG